MGYYGTRVSGVPNNAAETQKNFDFNYNYILKSIRNIGYKTIVVETRVESIGSCWRSICNFRPETELSDEASESAIQGLGEGRRRAHETQLRRR